MADRIHQYPLFPQNLASSSHQQSQMSQQPPQSQQPDPQMISALSNPEHARMWQQQMNQLQNTYRSQQSGDLATSQMNHQMQEFVRGPALSHGQGQPMVQQIQQSFALNPQRMNPSGPVFHDPQANLSQLLMSSNTPNVPMNSQQQMKAAFNMNPMMHTMSNPGASRQLKMLNQQDMARLQSGFGSQHPPNQQTAVDMFPSSAMQPPQDHMHGSPHPAAQAIIPPGISQGVVPGNQQPNVQKRMMTAAEFQERRNYLLTMISQSETNLANLLQTARSGPAMDPHLQQKINQLRGELGSRKDMYNKFVATFGAAVATQQLTPSSMPHINPMVHTPPQPPTTTFQKPATVPNSQLQPGFVTQATQAVTAQYNNNGATPMPAQNEGTLNQQLPIAAIQMGRPNTIPPRTGGTPHQVPSGQLSNAISPNLGNFTAQGGQKTPTPSQSRQSAGGIMPLDKQRFDSTYAHFCRSQNVQPAPRVTIGDNRSVDLHQLHVHVMHEGGASSVTQRDMWSVIGGRLGFVQFPGNETEPARSGPGIAQQLQNTYEQCLQHFENAYIMTVRNRPGASPQQSINPSPPTIGNNTAPSNLPEMSQNPRPVLNPQLIVTAARFAHTSIQDMRAQRVPEQMINFVERHRNDLVKVYQQQQMQLMAKRNAEHEQQNNMNAQVQLPSVPEQPSIGLQPGTQRPPMGANNVAGMPPSDTKMVNGSFVPDNAAVAVNPQLPTAEQLQQAVLLVNQLRIVFQTRSLPGIGTQQIPDEHRMEYNQLLEQVYKMASELDGRLHVYFTVFKNEDLLRRYVAIVMTVARQWQLHAISPPQYIIPLSNLRTMQMQIHKLNEEFDNRWRAMKALAAAANSQQQNSLTSHPTRSHAVPPAQNVSQIPPVPLINRQHSINPPQQQTLHPPPSHPQLQTHPPPPSHAGPSQLQHQQPPMPQPPKKPFPSIPPSPSVPHATANIASPTPPPVAASTSTPATSAPTPQTAVGSPQTPKSPPTKANSKGKATTRITRKVSTTAKGPATPETAPASVVGVKRPPEEDVSTLTNAAPSEAEASNAPSPKKAKTEWEGEPNEAVIKKQQELDNIKTDDDAALFFDRMKELFAMTATTDDEIHLDIASTLDQILAGVAQEPADAAATAAALSVHGVGDAGLPPTALSPPMGPANDAFLEFIDFSSFTTLDDEDNDSKAPTPDLVPSSETNPSPESGSEGDLLGGSGSPDKTKIEELGDRSDPLRLGSLREIDGGESAYYQTDNFKWEGSMHTIDQPWAIFTS